MITIVHAGQHMRVAIDDSYPYTQEIIFELERDSVLDLTVLMLGAVVDRSITVRLIGEGASATIKGIYVLSGDCRLTMKTKQEHTAPATTSSCTVKGILCDASSVYYGGTIYVAPHAHTTQARQSNKNMLLDSRARATSVPSLEVLTKQVQCAHGSAVGNLDQDALWYMLSRGVALQDARRMLLEGFVAEIIDPVPADVLEQIKKTVV